MGRASTRGARLLPALALVATLSVVAPAAVLAKPYCGDAGWRFTNIDRHMNRMRVLTGPYTYKNDTPNKQTFSVTKHVSGTVTYSASAEVGGGVDFAIAKVEAKVGFNLSRSKTVGESVSASMVVDPGKSGHLAFGVWRVVATGHSYYMNENCDKTSDRGRIKTYSPWRVGYRASQTRG